MIGQTLHLEGRERWRVRQRCEKGAVGQVERLQRGERRAADSPGSEARVYVST